MNAYKDARMDHRPLQCSRVLTRAVGVLAAVAIALSSTGVSAAPKGPPVWRDDFNLVPPDPAWFWVNETPGGWSLTEDPGFMQIQVSSAYTGGENLLLRSGAEGNFTIETRAMFKPTANHQFAGLVIYQDGANYVQLGRSYCDIPDQCVIGNGIFFNKVQNGGLEGGNFHKSTGDTLDKAFLRLELNGRKITAFYSDDGAAWQKIGQHTLPAKFQVTGVGLAASQDIFRLPEDPAPVAKFDYFSMTGNPKPSSPFVGHWQAVDGDGSDLRLTIGGPPQGPFQLTETDSYITYCDGEAGIAKGTGQVDDSSPYLLEATLTLKCLTTDAADRPMNGLWRYDPVSDTISQTEDSGLTTRWHRPGHPPPPPTWTIIARPADDAVDGGSLEPGTVVGLYVTSSEGEFGWYGTTVAEVPEWDPGNGWVQFNLGVDGYDLKATDHLWMTDGVNARELVVTPLEITGADLSSLTLGGRAEPGSQVFVDLPPDHTEVTTDQDGEWRVPFDVSHIGQVATAYQVDSDGDYTLAGWGIPMPRIVASEGSDFFWTTEFSPGASLRWALYTDPDSGSPLMGGNQMADQSGFIFIGGDVIGDLIPGNYLTVSEGLMTKTLVIKPIAIDLFDVDSDFIAGTAPLDTDVWVAAGPQDWQTGMLVHSNLDTGRWEADFTTLDPRFDITEEMRTWSYAQLFDEDRDANEADPPPAINLRVNYGHDWVESFYPANREVMVTVTDSNETVKATATVITEAKDFWGGNTGFQTVAGDWDPGPPDIQPGDWVYARVDNGATA